MKDVLEAHDAVEAFELMNSTHVDFLIVDVAMAPLSGLEFVKLVRTAEDSPSKYVPVIMLTANSEKSTVESARDAGATEIYRKVAAVINQPRQFVRTRQYFGPDRRRHKNGAFSGGDRRAARNGDNPGGTLSV